MTFDCTRVDYSNKVQGAHLIELLNAYARDPMGGEAALKSDVKKRLVSRLKNTPTAISILCYSGDKPVGLINAFEGFSTFAAAPLINLHDVYVASAFRGQGALEKMFELLEHIANEKACCKITLEVLSNNTAAKKAYLKAGFEAYALKDDAGHAVFWQKNLLKNEA